MSCDTLGVAWPHAQGSTHRGGTTKGTSNIPGLRLCCCLGKRSWGGVDEVYRKRAESVLTWESTDKAGQHAFPRHLPPTPPRARSPRRDQGFGPAGALALPALRNVAVSVGSLLRHATQPEPITNPGGEA